MQLGTVPRHTRKIHRLLVEHGVARPDTRIVGRSHVTIATPAVTVATAWCWRGRDDKA